MKKAILYSIWIASTFLISVSDSTALPRFALRGADINCRGCHVDPTGGRLRSEGGDNFAMNRLAMWPSQSKFSANIGEGIRIGVDLRTQYLYFSTHTAADFSLVKIGDSGRANTLIPIHKDTTSKTHGGLAMALPIYLSANLTEAVSAFVKVEPITGSWEGFGTIHVVHSSGEFIESGSVVGDAYVKIGAFLPAFGIRFDDHTIYTRGGNASVSGFPAAGLFWQPNYRDEGIEFGAELFDRAFITADILNGDEQFPGSPFKINPNEPLAVSLRGVVAVPIIEKMLSLEVGGSLYMHTRQNLKSVDKLNDSTANTQLAAVHGGVHLGPVSVLVEADFGNYVNHYATYNDKVHALAAEAAVDITPGLTGIVRFDNYNSANRDTTQVEVQSRIMLGLQWFPVRFLEIRPELRLAKLTVPASEGQGHRYDVSETTALIQTHIFF